MTQIHLKVSVIALFLLQAGFSFAQGTSAGGYTLTGIVRGISNGEVELSSYDSKNRTNTKINTVKIENGRFVMTGKVKSPEMMGLLFKPGNWSMQLFVENSNISINIDTTGSEHYDYTKYGDTKGARLKNFKISGSVSQADFEQYENNPVQMSYLNKIMEINKRFMAENSEEKKEAIRAEMTPFRTKNTEWQLKYIQQFLSKKPSSVAGAYMLSNYYMFNSEMPIAKMDQLLSAFTGEAKESIYYRNLNSDLTQRKAVLPGNLAEDFTLLQRDSTKFTLSSTRGKYVMIDFWASWCKPCRAAIPHWKEVYSKYKDKGFEIVSVTNDSRRVDWIKAMDVEQMPWIQTIDEFPVKMMPARVISKYKHGTIPLYVLLDKEGKILVKTGEEAEIDQKLAEIFKN